VAILNDYIISWEPKQTNYVAGETPAIQWQITRQDNGLVPVPTAGTVTLTYPDGTQQSTSAPYISSSTAAASINIGTNAFTLSQTGTYRAQIGGITFTGSDVQARSEIQMLQVNLPYDPTTLLGMTRFYAADTTLLDPDFTDNELQMLLASAEGAYHPRLAAACGLEAIASDNARLAVVTKKGTRGNDESAVYKALVETAANLRANTISLPVTTANVPQAFTIGSADGATVGTMDVW
jgi:hypothetical protein